MSLRLVARKDFLDFVRSKAFWSVSVVFFLLIVGDAYFYTSHSYNSGTAMDVVLDLLSAARVLVPLVALLVGYRALVVLLFWAIVPLALGYWRFEKADIQ